jgi:predicted ATPase
MLAFELLAGRHPFDLRDPERLRRQTMNERPNMGLLRVDTAEQERQIGAILSRLLAKDPANRYPNARRVIRALSEAMDQPVPHDSAGIRESFLQAASFVGREAEMTTLQDALQSAARGDGSAWNIQGEYGVGKSRLLEELRSRVAVEGTTVLFAQAPQDGGLPYHPWRYIVRHLLLFTPISDFEAGVLKEIVPDIAQLLNLPVPDIPRLEARDQQQRLSLTIVSLFTRQERPILLVIEDVHWLHESLIPLRHLCDVVTVLPLLIVCSYNSEEAVMMADKLPPMRSLTLQRFDEKAVEALAVSILGDAAQKSPLPRWLMQETEGLAFFVVEVMRALADEAGQLDRVTQVALPDHVATLGIIELAQWRLKRVTFDHHPMLRLAAVVGRDLDLNILRHIDDELDYDRWLSDCSEALILEYVQGRWRFTHEKMREGILYGLEDRYRADLNAAVAAAIESIYPNNTDYAIILVEHWHQAGNSEREAHYALIAAEHAWALNSFPRIIRICERARHSLAANADQYPDHLMQLLYWQARAHFRMGEMQNARLLHERSLAMATARKNQSMWVRNLRGLGAAVSMEGDYRKATRIAEQALSIAKKNDDALMTAELLGMSLAPIKVYQGELATAQELSESALALLEQTPGGEQWHIARILSNLAEIARLQGDVTRCRVHLERSQRIAHKISDRQIIAFGRKLLGDLDAQEMNATAALEHYAEALATFRHLHEMPMVAGVLADRAYLVLKFNSGEPNKAKLDLQEALDIVHSMQVPLLLTRVLLRVAEYYVATSRLAWAAELSGSLSHHLIPNDLSAEWTTLHNTLQRALNADQLRSAEAQGKNQPDLRAVATQILRDWR